MRAARSRIVDAGMVDRHKRADHSLADLRQLAKRQVTLIELSSLRMARLFCDDKTNIVGVGSDSERAAASQLSAIIIIAAS